MGGTGFIGHHLSKKFLKHNNIVSSISQKKPKKKFFIKKVNYLFCDISNKKKLFKILENKSFDIVINCGGYVDHSKKEKTFKSHYLGCKNLVDFFKSKKIIKFIQIGSSLEYGDSKCPHKETARINIKKLKSSYSKAKYLATEYLMKQKKKNDFPCLVFRLYLTYGPKQDVNRLIPIVINHSLKKEKFLTSDGLQYRDFIYIDDVVKIIHKSSKSNYSGEIFNLGSGEKTKVKYLINLILKKIKFGHADFGKIKLRPDEQKFSYSSMKKTKKYFKIKFFKDLESGLDKTIDYYKNE